MTHLIGIVGLIGSGKNTIGDYLVNKHQFKSDSLAAPLKDAIAAIFGWNRTLLEGNTEESRRWRDTPDEWWEKELNWQKDEFSIIFPRFTPRVCLQIFGTDVCRNKFHNDIWVLSLKNRLQKTNDNVVVTDCRFPNECKTICDLGGIIIRVQRGEEPDWMKFVRQNIHLENWFKICSEHTVPVGIHYSEWASLRWSEDICIKNDYSLSCLHDMIESVLTTHKQTGSK